MNILAFEPFDTGSHRAVRQSISRHSAHTWTWLTRPGRSWKWRMRTAAIECAQMVREQGVLPADIDVLFVTSLMSASDLRALLPIGFRDKPLILYMHENQMAYPTGQSDVDPRDAHFVLTNLTSAAAADRVIFNSQWNHQSFLDGARDVLQHSRDGKLTHLLPMIEAKSCVIWPPVEPPPIENQTSSSSTSNRPTTILWPHRWEHDKGPQQLLDIARQYTHSHNLRWIILGEHYNQTPEALNTFKREFAAHIQHIGYVESRSEYWQWLTKADWVLSTAHHEFFGIAVVEALLTGALPWLPQRLSYPELLPTVAHNLSPVLNPPADINTTRAAIHEHLKPAFAPNAVHKIDAELLSWQQTIHTGKHKPQSLSN